ncbi:unnamed protein product [Lactuca virosa]|uniref:Uncharacterized protein n=1 Tax=Lactuca virosa TaxID=75947 RepID=A0AAU9MGN1_9ASTR|nr:unnamed protein product [Lactuca virosa]
MGGGGGGGGVRGILYDCRHVRFIQIKIEMIQQQTGNGRWEKEKRYENCQEFCFAYRTGLPESNGYIYIDANGGLNQQRTSVI